MTEPVQKRAKKEKTSKGQKGYTGRSGSDFVRIVPATPAAEEGASLFPEAPPVHIRPARRRGNSGLLPVNGKSNGFSGRSRSRLIQLKGAAPESAPAKASAPTSDFASPSRSRLIRPAVEIGPTERMMTLGAEKRAGYAARGASGFISLQDLSQALEEKAELEPVRERNASPRPEPLKKAEAPKPRKKKKVAKKASKAKTLDKPLFEAHKPEKGDPFVGPLTFGVGESSRGLRQSMSIFGAVFVISLMLISAGGIGIGELSLSVGEPMIFARAALMCIAALVGILVLRGEKLDRIGLSPRLGALLVSLCLAGVMGIIASVLVRFEVAAQASLTTLGVLLMVRAVAEVVFFQGFITRTLLIEMKNPAHAVMISAGLYGLYALTYLPILQASPGAALYAVLVYTLGGGLPFALMYYKTRSVPALVVCQFIVLFAAAWGGLSHALKLAS